MPNRRGISWAVTLTLLLPWLLITGCSGIQNTLPDVDETDTRAALVEIEDYSPEGSGSAISYTEAQRRLWDAYDTIKPAAVELCRHTGESRVCAWDVKYSDLGEYNAFATSGNQVVVFHGIISETDSEGELAYVLAHELAHHIANHIDESRDRANMGMLVTGIGLAGLAQVTPGCSSSTCLSAVQNAAQASMQLGGNVGILMFSVDQEKEADYLAAYILARSGYDLNESRNMILKFGAKSDQTETGFMNSHPAPPERLASFDKTVEEIQSDRDGLPGADSLEYITAQNAEVGSDDEDTPARDMEPNTRNCRIYLPEDNICIY